ncbi:MAG TPA: hypothetical protein VJ672_13335 [Gemmatimonadaceae bacterium]|nr:hypothetical protein [Gemmatimonadaceae bacterium]
MAETLTLAVGGLALLTFVLLGVMIELYRDVRQLREVNGILDRPLDVDVGEVAGTEPSRYGLPRALDGVASGLLLFLSDRCGTCHALAAGFDGALPPGLWVVLEARGPEATEEFLARYRFTAASTAGRLWVDVAGRVADQIGLRTTPVAFRIENGRIAGATTVPSRRYLSSILPNRVRLERPVSHPVEERARV